MKCPTLSELPAPPQHSTGWPWTQQATALPDLMPNGGQWPRISVVTPSYNQGQFLEKTIRSVLLQGYPDLEYIVIDGGSTDDSVEIIKKYEKWMTYWVSEKDRGQSHAINKGFERTSGQIMCWLNSDDFYLPPTLKIVAENLADETGNYALVGHMLAVFTDGRESGHFYGAYENYQRLLEFWKGYQMHQPSIFWRREVFDKVGFLDEDQYLIMDFDYWARIGRYFDFKDIDEVLSGVTFHDQTKTSESSGGSARYHRDLRRQGPRYWGSPLQAYHWQMRASMINYLYVRPPLSRLKRRVLKRLFGIEKS